MSRTAKAVLIASLSLGTLYFILLPLASNGYGYMGYHGYHHGPSFWYYGGPDIYHDRSARSGSIGGTNPLGGGPGSGK